MGNDPTLVVRTKGKNKAKHGILGGIPSVGFGLRASGGFWG